MLDFSELQSHVDSIKDKVEQYTQNKQNATDGSSDKAENEDEGEVCMHGNSWHSGCVECDDLMLIDNIFDVVDSTPNNMELGKKIRIMCGEYRKNNKTTDDDNTIK